MQPQYWSIERLPGITPEQQQLLDKNQITNTKELLKLAHSPELKQALAIRLQLNQKYINKWVALADLARIPSVGDWRSLAEGIAIAVYYYTLV